MSEKPATGSWSLPPSRAQQVDQVCNGFEAAWKAGQQPRIEQYLRDTPEPERGVLLRELLVLELAYRRIAGEKPTPEEYQPRFADHVELIRTVFCQAEAAALSAAATETLPHYPAAGASAPPPTTELATADWPRIPGYEILEKLDPGGMGVVYKARQLTLNRVVALKMIRSGEHAEPQELKRFHGEAKAVARLDHLHIVRVHDFGEHNGRPYFAMEFVEGGSLAHALGGQPLPPEQAAALLAVLALAMHYVHQQGIIHRDLKPANILLQARGSPRVGLGTPKIADFGLAKSLDENLKLTASKTILGTASYMAPEQAEGKTHEISPATDVYALGAILYEMLTGQPPFRAPTRELTIFQVLSEEPVPPTRRRPDVPRDLETICLRCLEKDPRQRYASAAALAEDLRRFQEGEAISIQALGEWEWTARWAKRAGYEIVDLLGASVLGLIYKARQVSLNRIVLLKTISAKAQTDPAKMARFQAQAEIAARLQHPNIVQIYDFGEQNGQPYFALEFVDGGTLAEKCVGSPLAAREAARLIQTLARAVHYAHQQGIIHSDLRPFNVLLTTTGDPKITGFGLARLLETEPRELELNEAPLGLSNYMAPEQAEGRIQEIGVATDIHALGAMLYELLTGLPPFLAETVRSHLEQVRFQEPRPLSQIQPDVPRRLEAICLKCLQKLPRQRYASALDLAEDLDRFLTREQTRTEEFELVPGYEVLEELGRGGMGVVHKARQVSLDRLVALKIFRENLGRFLAANRAMARLHHPNLVEIHDCGEREGLLYVAEELVDGGSLEQKIAGQFPSPREAAQLLETLARAMHYVHQHAIVHRNLKPRVVLLTVLGIPKISSFDLAKLLDQEPDDTEMEGQLIGTPAYMAPEQMAGRVKEIGPAADIYALGGILYKLLTGRPPFQGYHLLELREQVRTQEPLPPSRLQPKVPGDLETICLKCLEKEPGQRHASAEALADDLRRFLDGKRVHARPSRVWGRLAGWWKQRPLPGPTDGS